MWCDWETLREECPIRCCSEADEKKLKQCKTMEKMEGFLLARCRGGCQLTSNITQGVRTCNVDIVREDLKERGLYTRDMNEAEQRKVMEATFRLEDEAKRMKALRRDKRFEEEGGMSTDIERVIIDALHAPMRMNEKVLYLLYSKAMDNRTKAKAALMFAQITTKNPASFQKQGLSFCRKYNGC